MKQEKERFVAGEYTPQLLTSIGEIILRDYVEESNLAISNSQRYNSEVRTKALGTVGLFTTIIIALFVALYSIGDLGLLTKAFLIFVIFTFGHGLYRIFKDIVYSKTNYNGGSTLTYLLPQNIIDSLTTASSGNEKVCLHLYYMLERKEETCNDIDKETGRMQECYVKALNKVIIALTISSIIYFSLFLLSSLVALLAEMKIDFLMSLIRFLF